MLFLLITSGLLSAASGFPTNFSLAMGSEESLENEIVTTNYQLVCRPEWHARTPKAIEALNGPVSYVVIHHSYTPKACFDGEQCSNAMRSMQKFHMDDRGWADVGYHFAVGSDGKAYEGRGWGVLGAHALHFNSVSVGICLIGDWSDTLPPSNQLHTTKALIADGVSKGYISPNYKLVGHRQVRATLCPGDTLYNAIQKWPHYVDFPKTYKDLKYVPELAESIRNKLT